MRIKDLPKYVDIRNTIRRNGRYPYVGTAVKDTHVIHHSMTPMSAKGSNPHSFANTHIDKKGWHGVAYAFVIMPDGTIYHCDDLDRRTYHAGNTNTRSIGTCLVGDFRTEGAAERPTKEQMVSLYLLNKALHEELPNMKRVLGHQECPGYSWKNCPGNTWDYKKVISGEVLDPKDINVSKPKTEASKPQSSKPVDEPDYSGKRVESKVDGLRFYNKPSWDDKDLAGTFNKGYGFTIVDGPIKVGGGYQFKVKNSKGSIYYVTASEKYVKVEGGSAMPAPSKPKTSNGIPVIGYIQIVNVKYAAYICDRPSSTNSKNLATIAKGKKIAISGSVPGWYEVIYNGRRAYVNGKYGKRV